MASNLIKQKDKIFIDNIPALKWAQNRDNSFIRSAQLTLNAIGEDYSYDYLMGISRAAFRFHFNPGIPIIAINLKVCPEWGIIAGYQIKMGVFRLFQWVF